jgi:hypothetical protein
MASDVDDILNKIGASDERGEIITNDKVIPFERKQEKEPEKEPVKKEETLQVEPEDVSNLLEFINNFLEKREDLKRWKLDPIETKNATTLIVRLSEKYGVYLMTYALEIEAVIFLIFYYLARQEPESEIER